MLLLTLSFIFLIVFTYYCRQKLNYWNKRGVLNNQPKTPVGDLLKSITHRRNVFLLIQDLYNRAKEKREKYAGFYFTLGPVFVPVDLELTKRILATDFDYFSERGLYYDRNKLPLTDNLFSARAERSKYLREMLATGFTPAKIKTMAPIIEFYAKSFSNVIGENEGQPVDIFRMALRYTLDIICNTYFGVNEHNLKSENSRLLKFASQFSVISMKYFVKLCFAYDITNPGNIFIAQLLNNETSAFIYEYGAKLYEIRKNKRIQGNDILQNLVNNLEDENNDFDFASFVAQIFILFLSTFKTNSLLITYTLYQLGKEKDVQDKLRCEINRAQEKNNAQLSIDNILELDYLDRVLTESSRVHTVVPALNRSCRKPYKVPGSDLIIEKGTPIMVSALAIHKDPDIFADPEKFDPDRFLDTELKNNVFTFGYGQKHCIGKRLGLMLIKAAIVQIVKNHEISINEKTGPQLENLVFSKHLVWLYKNKIWLDFKRIR